MATRRAGPRGRPANGARRPGSAPSHADAPEPGGRRAVADVRRLARLAFAAVGDAPEMPRCGVPDGIHRRPELGRHAGVDRVPNELPELAVHDPTSDLGAELEVEP